MINRILSVAFGIILLSRVDSKPVMNLGSASLYRVQPSGKAFGVVNPQPKTGNIPAISDKSLLKPGDNAARQNENGENTPIHYDFSGKSITKRNMNRFAVGDFLKRLFNSIHPSIKERVAKIQQVSTKEPVIFNFNHLHTTPKESTYLLESIQRFDIRELSLRGATLGESGTNQLVSLIKGKKDLTKLDLTETGLYASEFPKILNVLPQSNIKTLILDKNKLFDDRKANAIITSFAESLARSKVKQLSLAGDPVFKLQPKYIIELVKTLNQKQVHLDYLNLKGQLIYAQKSEVKALLDALSKSNIKKLDISFPGVKNLDNMLAGNRFIRVSSTTWTPAHMASA